MYFFKLQNNLSQILAHTIRCKVIINYPDIQHALPSTCWSHRIVYWKDNSAHYLVSCSCMQLHIGCKITIGTDIVVVDYSFSSWYFILLLFRCIIQSFHQKRPKKGILSSSHTSHCYLSMSILGFLPLFSCGDILRFFTKLNHFHN